MLAARLERLFFALVLMVLCLAPAAAGVTGNISGHVTDEKANPVSGARVSVSSPSQSVTAQTDARVFYSVLDLSPDTYTITVTKDGFDPSTVYGVTVQTNQTAGVNIALR